MDNENIRKPDNTYSDTLLQYPDIGGTQMYPGSTQSVKGTKKSKLKKDGKDGKKSNDTYTDAYKDTDIDLIQTLNESKYNSYNEYINNEYLDTEIIEAMNESVKLYESEILDRNKDIIFQKELDKAIKENELLEKERQEKQKLNELDIIERHHKLNNFQQHLVYADMDKTVIDNIKKAIQLFLDTNLENLDSNSHILLNDISYSTFINFLDTKKHRINIETIKYIKEHLKVIS